MRACFGRKALEQRVVKPKRKTKAKVETASSASSEEELEWESFDREMLAIR
jgi:hypothetical protein